VEGEEFVVAALEDISHQKRLGVLARIFFHDVMNTVVAMKNFVRLIVRKSAKKRYDAADLDCLGELTDQLAEEIQSQRDLTLAEAGDLEVDPQPVRAAELLERLCGVYASHEVAAGRRIAVADSAEGELTTDVRLLSRVLGNMLRNALEATQRGGVVTVRSEGRGDRVVFQVHNNAVMPKNVQMQVFHRSFSTKGVLGRGIGTHSMKLLGERYLHGEVGFSSQTPQGTTFWIELPSRWPQNGSS
jgi:signal transduction histidine kinase